VAGELSLAQAHDIVRAERACPGSEGRLVELTRTSAPGSAREAARKTVLEAMDVAELARHQRRARDAHHWRDELGMVRLDATLRPEFGVGIVNRLDAETDRLWRAGKQRGELEPRAAYAADALVALLSESGGTRPGLRAEVVFVTDGRAAHIIGGGPVPVSVAFQAAAQGAFVKILHHDGVKVDLVAHVGRHRPAVLRTVLELGPPPGFEGVVCAEPGCDKRYGLEWDHVDPVANGGLTSYDNLVARCWVHHQEKTERDRKAGLLKGAPRDRDPP
jgi:hypothetical protein